MGTQSRARRSLSLAGPVDAAASRTAKTATISAKAVETTASVRGDRRCRNQAPVHSSAVNVHHAITWLSIAYPAWKLVNRPRLRRYAVQIARGGRSDAKTARRSA